MFNLKQDSFAALFLENFKDFKVRLPRTVPPSGTGAGSFCFYIT